MKDDKFRYLIPFWGN